MATFHSGSEGQTQKLQALRRRQKRLAFRAVIVPPVCWGICAASAPWWFPPLKETLGVRFDAQTQGWILLVLMLLMISLPVLISLHLKRRARGAKYAATLVSSGIRGEEDARALLSRLPGRVHLYPNRIVHAGNRSECDLVALCRRGATVIEVKNHAGTVTGDLSDHDLLLTRKNGTGADILQPRHAGDDPRADACPRFGGGGCPLPGQGVRAVHPRGHNCPPVRPFPPSPRHPRVHPAKPLPSALYILHRGKRLRRREVRALRRFWRI